MTVLGAVLCGGASSRMGADKALLPVQGTPMVVRVSDALRSGGCQRVVAIGGDGAAIAALGIEWCADEWPGEGPLGGVLTALSRAGDASSHVVVVACDLPFLRADTVAQLVESAVGSAQVVAARTDRLEPLCAVWPVAARHEVQQVFVGGARAVAAALDRVGVVEVAVPVGDLRNVNTRGDLGE